MAWIANGESGASIRGKLNSLMIPISSGKITTPVEYFDVAIPGGYDALLLYANNLAFSTGDLLAAAFSADNGVSFVNDAVHADSYLMNNIPDTADALMVLSGHGDVLVSAVLQIWPGNTSVLPLVMFTSSLPIQSRFAGSQGYSTGAGLINAAATVTPTTERYNLIRLLPLGNGDCNPPTSGETITAGSWALFGIPTPA